MNTSVNSNMFNIDQFQDKAFENDFKQLVDRLNSNLI